MFTVPAFSSSEHADKGRNILLNKTTSLILKLSLFSGLKHNFILFVNSVHYLLFHSLKDGGKYIRTVLEIW